MSSKIEAYIKRPIRTASEATAEAPTTKPKRERSYAALLSRLYESFDATADALDELPAEKRAAALSQLARTLPLIQAAEQAAKTKAKGKDITALTDAELETLVSAQLREKAVSPFSVDAAPVAPSLSKNKKNRNKGVGEIPTPDATTEDEE